MMIARSATTPAASNKQHKENDDDETDPPAVGSCGEIERPKSRPTVRISITFNGTDSDP
jgi:hypothetical protein